MKKLITLFTATVLTLSGTALMALDAGKASTTQEGELAAANPPASGSGVSGGGSGAAAGSAAGVGAGGIAAGSAVAAGIGAAVAQANSTNDVQHVHSH